MTIHHLVADPSFKASHGSVGDDGFDAFADRVMEGFDALPDAVDPDLAGPEPVRVRFRSRAR
ncbi:hypothetical protein [Nocardiopsis protaetiae]|uniref:hypothetical protein n=1 Tax=Nocardiopsis protaetiae TaxID=3382270 RepID=UPI00387B02D1